MDYKTIRRVEASVLIELGRALFGLVNEDDKTRPDVALWLVRACGLRGTHPRTTAYFLAERGDETVRFETRVWTEVGEEPAIDDLHDFWLDVYETCATALHQRPIPTDLPGWMFTELEPDGTATFEWDDAEI